MNLILLSLKIHGENCMCAQFWSSDNCGMFLNIHLKRFLNFWYSLFSEFWTLIGIVKFFTTDSGLKFSSRISSISFTPLESQKLSVQLHMYYCIHAEVCFKQVIGYQIFQVYIW